MMAEVRSLFCDGGRHDFCDGYAINAPRGVVRGKPMLCACPCHDGRTGPRGQQTTNNPALPAE